MSVSEAAGRVNARERVLSAAYPLFARRGVRDVGIDEIIHTAGVAKATFYRHFPSKEALVLAFLQRRDEVFGINIVLAEVRQRAGTAEECLLGIFDVFAKWFARPDYEACSFINTLLEMGAGDPAGQASLGYLGRIREEICLLAQEAGLRDVEEFSWSWRILMAGSIIAAAEGDAKAAARAKRIAGRLIAEHRPA